MPDCPENTYFESGQCVSASDPKCEADFVFNGKNCVAVREPSCPDGHSYSAASGECFDKVQPECRDGEIFEGGQCKLVTAPCVEYKFCSTEAQGQSGPGSEPKPAGGSGDKSQPPPSEDKRAGFEDFIKQTPDDAQPPSEEKRSGFEDFIKESPDDVQPTEPPRNGPADGSGDKSQAPSSEDKRAGFEDFIKQTPDDTRQAEPPRDGPSDSNVPKPTGEDQMKDGSQQVTEQPNSGNANLNDKTPPQVMGGDNTGSGNGKAPNVPPETADSVRLPGGDGEAGHAGSGRGGAWLEYGGKIKGGPSEEEAARKKGGRWVEYDEELPAARKSGRRWIEDDDDAAGGELPTDQKGSGNIAGQGGAGNFQGSLGADGRLGQDGGSAWGGGNMGAGGRREWSWTSQGGGAGPYSGGGSWKFGADTGNLNGGLGLKFSGGGGLKGQQQGIQVPDGSVNGDGHLSKFLNGDHDHILDGLRGSGKGSEGVQRPTGDAGGSSRLQWGDSGFIKGGFGGGQAGGGSEAIQRPTADASGDSHLSKLLSGDNGYLRGGAGAQEILPKVDRSRPEMMTHIT